MTKTIVGLFDKAQEADSAAQDLIHHGFDRGDVRVVTPEATRSANPVDLLVDAGVPASDARDYDDELRNGASLVAVKTDDSETPRAMDILRAHGLSDVSSIGGPVSGTAGGTAAEAKPGQTMPIIEEQIQVGKQRVRTGGVRIHSRVVEQPVEAEVKLRQEHVDVERRPADRPATEEDLRAFKEGTVEIRETLEEPVVSKEARVVGEVQIGREVEERTETVRDTVRRTEVDVERLGGSSETGAASGSAARTDYNTPVDQTREQSGSSSALAGAPMTFEAAESDFRSNFDSNYSSKYRYEQFRPAYRYGYDLAISRSLQNRSWDEIDPEARRRWEELNPGTWDRFKNAVVHAFRYIRGS